MKVEDIKKVGVVGAGAMGAGIAQVFAQKGFTVFLVDEKEEMTDKAFKKIVKNVLGMLDKAKITSEEADDILFRIVSTTLEKLSIVDFVIEAVPENLKLKKHIFTLLNTIVRPEVILATNTSSLSLVDIATASGRPRKVVGMHFMNPATVMKLVEVVKSPATEFETVEFAKKLVEKLGKTPVEVNDSPAFVVNRILIPMLNEAIGLLEEEVATKEDIDKAMKLGAAYPMGPFELADFIGLDVVLAIMKELCQRTGDSKYAPATLLEKKVALRELGRKTGKGFYEYGGK